MKGPKLAPGRWSADIASALETMIAEYGADSSTYDPSLPPVAALDFDETCIFGDISHALLDELAARRPERDWVGEYEQGCRHDVRSAYATLVEWLVEGHTDASLRALTLSVLDKALASGEIQIRAEMQDLVHLLQLHGWQVWVVTASPRAVVQHVAQRYGVPACRVLGMEVRRDAAHRFAPSILEPITYRQGKVDALTKATSGRTPTFAAGDSMTDYELLCSADHGLLIERDPTFSTRATEHNWWVQRGWSSP